MKNEKCKICESGINNEYINYKLKSIEGNILNICDECFQEISILAKENNKWVTYVLDEDIKYYENL
jgi:ribosome-binding protein aMBF1 (putative translation factor)